MDLKQFDGITKTMCAAGCNVNGCVITAKAYCGHPGKSALHQAEQLNPEVVARRKAAFELLAQQEAAAKAAALNSAA